MKQSKLKNLFQIPGLNGMPGFGNFQKHMDNFLGDEFLQQFQKNDPSTTTATYNFYENESELLYVFNIPGIQNVDTIEVRLQGKTLFVSGNITLHYNGFELKTSGITTGEFQYNIDLPFSVRQDKVEASYENGLLQILLFRVLATRDDSEIVPVMRRK